jgi:hypothetical protein
VDAVVPAELADPPAELRADRVPEPTAEPVAASGDFTPPAELTAPPEVYGRGSGERVSGMTRTRATTAAAHTEASPPRR